MATLGSSLAPTSSTLALSEIRPDKDWFRFSGRHPLAALLVTGFVATQTTTMIGFFMPVIGLPVLNWPLDNGHIGAPGTAAGSAGQYFVGQFMHYLNGFAFILIFALLAYSKLPFRDTNLGNFLKAQAFCVILSIISAGFLVPLIYSPGKGMGFFSFGHGWKLPFAILLWHLIFGLHIAALYNPGRVRRLQLEDRAAADAAG
ncbi:MAG: hypothetical protein JWQ81_8771 [Amycolatopsis sp.]|jgi:hypothetical protein|uniref:hypothetical protein n=1 Tax=Amycolatopsis sp. TaxID=37632 RepID=UPI00261FD178|nr:hypothetical protein [Amycolatopsis sp.]MCU1688032.1 hypothetical protein [Amycolatopsis sp.]